ncbi:hypothetical protein EW026_g1339 [Hermanssonia centrifuga]|uniref:Microbial-type PARG catalytic domain-containing protein n=1 Tax=Hermanssonia centrifuga TaxID=98765 RepID=A0A4S4KRP5_9APHY|nr:hypothetical protein EW026_g1339 [Hermanssonia centrifuga]
MQQRKHSARPSRQRRTKTPSQIVKRAASQDVQRQRVKKQHIKNLNRRQKPLSISKQKPPNPRFKILSLAVRKATRERWAGMAEETQRIVLGDGKYVEERCVPVASSFAQPHTQGPLVDSSANQGPQTLSSTQIAHDIFAQVQLCRQGTTFYPHYSPTLANWANPPRQTTDATRAATAIDFMHCSTLTAARRLSSTMSDPNSGSSNSSIGVMSFASPKKPGGGYLHGGNEQEETIARLSSLVASLSSPAAQDFYKEHKKYRAEDGSGLHDHSIVYSPCVSVFRADVDDDNEIPSEDAVGGAFIPPYTINVLSAVPVNAAAVRSKHVILPAEQQFFADGIRGAMKERMARALRVFEERGDRIIVLGAFGCGSSENKVETIAAIWAELLVCEDDEGRNRFHNVFERVVFAVPGKLYEPFKRAFEMRLFESQVSEAVSTD